MENQSLAPRGGAVAWFVLMEGQRRTENKMKTTRETKWKVAVVAMLMGLAALSAQVWQARSGERFCAEQARRAVAQMQQQAAGAGNFLMAKNVPVPCFW
ncbi:MAG: hypothetical protein NTY53_17400 [Kiritimatiellaeota bacterium]|nr:hypothetical protein [Kiritimatiellota bacterium]